jgi:hypothetical protein
MRLELALSGLAPAGAIPHDTRIARAWLEGKPIDVGWVRDAVAPIVPALESSALDCADVA